MTEHPMAEAVPLMIDAMGAKRALRWWMQWGVEWDTNEALRLSNDACQECARGNVDFILVDDDGEPIARAFQWVRIFQLEPFVEAWKRADAGS